MKRAFVALYRRVEISWLIVGYILLFTAAYAGGQSLHVSVGGAETQSGSTWDIGSVTLTINEAYTTSVSYGQFSTPASIASAIAAKVTNDCGSDFVAGAHGADITVYPRHAGVVISEAYIEGESTAGAFQASFQEGSPNIQKVAPSSAVIGKVIHVQGENFGEGIGAASVNGLPARILRWSQNQVDLRVPKGATSGSIVLNAPNGASNKAAFVVLPAPIIQWPTPTSLPGPGLLPATALNATASIAGSFTYTPAEGTLLGPGLQHLQVRFDPADTDEYSSELASVNLNVGEPNTSPVLSIQTIAGNGSLDISGLPGTPTLSGQPTPLDVSSSPNGTIYSANEEDVSTSSALIKHVYLFKLDPVTNTESIVAGETSDNGLYPVPQTQDLPASSAYLGSIRSVAVDSHGNVFVSGTHDGTQVICESNAGFFCKNRSIGYIYDAVAVSEAYDMGGANQTANDGSPAMQTVYLDGIIRFDGYDNLYVASGSSLGNTTLSMVDSQTNIVSTVAGKPQEGYPPVNSGDGGPATSAFIGFNSYAVTPEGDFYFSTTPDYFLKRPGSIRWVDHATGIIQTLTTLSSVTLPFVSPDNGTSELPAATGLALDAEGDILFQLEDYNQIEVWCRSSVSAYCKSTQPGSFATVAGNGQAGFSGDGEDARYSQLNMEALLGTPRTWNFFAVDTSDNLFIPDQYNRRVRKVGSAFVSKPVPQIVWAPPAAIIEGTALVQGDPSSTAQLDATVTGVPGILSYSPASGTILSVGTHMLTVTFVPADPSHYTIATLSVPIAVLKAAAQPTQIVPSITWSTPSPITSSTPLTSQQLDASAGSIQGTFLYTPDAGTLLPIGRQTISTTFTPADPKTYTSVTASVNILVEPGANATVPVYSYSIAQGNTSGYYANGDVRSYSDSVNGTWSGITYSGLDQLSSATRVAADGTATNFCWAYDGFGNRLNQQQTASACDPSITSTGAWTQIDQTTNRIVGTPDMPVWPANAYDAAGNLEEDGTNQYKYDAEGRICAVLGPSPISGGPQPVTVYIYDSSGTRVSKAVGSTFSCDLTALQSISESYVLGPEGDAITTTDGSGKWLTTSVFKDGELMGIYDSEGLHFVLNDWLGTRRVQTNYQGVAERVCSSTPFGEDSCSGVQLEVNRAFTGKERDTESGLDYFGARYYGSSMGRFMSPDWSAQAETVPYAKLGDPQSLNLYSYMLNNPLAGVDADGHWPIMQTWDPSWWRGVGNNFKSFGMGVAKGLVNMINMVQGDCSCQSRTIAPVASSNAMEAAGMLSSAVVVPGISISVSAAAVPALETESVASTSLIQSNAAQGAAWEDAVGASLRQTDPNTASQVTLETQSGVRTRMDFVSQDANGNISLTEAKSSATARLTANQAAAHPEIANTGATVVGQGKPGYPGGTQIPPTTVNVVRPPQ